MLHNSYFTYIEIDTHKNEAHDMHLKIILTIIYIATDIKFINFFSHRQ